MVSSVTIKEFEQPEHPEAEDYSPEANTPEFIKLEDRSIVAPDTLRLPEEHSGTFKPRSAVFPERFSLGTLGDGRLRVRKPIDVTRTVEDGQCILESPAINEFGFGKNFAEALADLQATIVELYFTLAKEQGNLGPDLAEVWTELSENLLEAPCH